jgi:GTP-dependent phosphoenolpyruvate carboxykinase
VSTSISHTRRSLNPVVLPRYLKQGDEGSALARVPGNSRVLAWILGRIEGTTAALQTPIGSVPTADDLDLTGLDVDPADIDEWQAGSRSSRNGSPRSAQAADHAR